MYRKLLDEVKETAMTIKDIKTEFGLTNKQIADDLKIPLHTVDYWSAGYRQPPEYLLLLIREHYQNKKEQI